MLNDISLAQELELRLADADDRAFVEQVFRSTREYLYMLPLPREQIDALAAQQYRLQQASYARQWPNAYTLIIQMSGRNIGQITVDESEAALRIIDIAFEPNMRGKGYGTAVLGAIQAHAKKRHMTIKLSVDRQNLLAKKLYLHLGFEVDAVFDTHESMIWSPSRQVFQT